MLASKLLPEQEEQQLQQLNDLSQEQGPTSSRQQTGHVQVCLLSPVQIRLQSESASWVAACIDTVLWMFGTHLHHLRIVMGWLTS